MKEKMKRALLFTVAMLPFAAIGGYFTGKYAFASYTKDMQELILSQVGSVELLAVVSMIQSVMYAAFCGFVGYLLADRTGLVKAFRLRKEFFIKTLCAALICGVLFSLDYWIFGKAIPPVAASYESGLLVHSVDNWLASVFYGGIVEELMLRWFLMSFVVWVLWKLIYKKAAKEEIPQRIFWMANILCALLFAAGHLPATVSMFGELTPLILLRCFLLNGSFGIVFGRLYQKYGIQYAFVGHMGTHIIAKVIWSIFI